MPMRMCSSLAIQVENRSLYLFAEALLVFKAKSDKSDVLLHKSTIPLAKGTQINDLRAWELPKMKGEMAEDYTAGWTVVAPMSTDTTATGADGAC